MRSKKNRSSILWTLLIVMAMSTVSSAEVTIKFAHWLGDPVHGHDITAFFDEVQRQVAPYGIKVEPVINNPTGYTDKVLVMAAGGIAPDVIMEVPYRIDLVSSGVLRDLTTFLERDKDVNFKSFIPSLWDSYTYFGGTWLVPGGVSPYYMFYNKEHFQDAGVGFPDGSWRWNVEVDQAIRKLQKKDANGKVTRYGMLYENRPWTEVFSFGGDILSPDTKRCVLGSTAVTDAFLLIQNWYKEGLIPKGGNQRPAFMRGDGALHAVMGSFAFPLYAEQNVIDWAITYVPQGPAGRKIEENTSGWGISSTTAHPEEAWIVVKAAASISGRLAMQSLGGLSPMRGKVDTEAYQFIRSKFGRSQQEVQIMTESMNYMRPSFRHPKGVEITAIANKAALDMMWNGKSPNTLKDAETRINALLAE